MGSFFYNLFINPISQILEFFYVFFYSITNNNGISIIGLSFVVSLFTLPLYIIAEQWQEVERNKQSLMKSGIERIKSTFKGDEQYMILSTFYKQNHYHPLMALRSSFSLLIQIPFFIAAYHFLSNLEALRGTSFLFIKDFGSPDSTFKIGNFSINILPIAMTLINCISGAIYSKGHEIKEKVQIYVCAAVFLVLLYTSPAGLVVYWTMNNVISLIKNIFYKLKNPKKILYILLCCFAASLIVFILFIRPELKKIIKILILIIAILLPALPFIIIKLFKVIKGNFKYLDENPKLRFTLFIISAIVLASLLGLSIPSTLIASEPNNYCFIENYKSPFIFIFIPFIQAIGLCILWPSCFYGLFSKDIKKYITVLFLIISSIALVNTFAFSESYGPINPNLLFMDSQSFMPSAIKILINLIIIVAVPTVIFIILKFKSKIIVSFYSIILFSLVILSSKNIISINKEYSKMTPPEKIETISPIYNLSKTEPNVVIFMLDRCVSEIFNQVLNNNNDIRYGLTGFTYYPNTVTLGYYTITGSPGLFGGYDYTPFESNKNTEKTIQQKHNESLLTLPIVFNQNNFTTTVSNLPYENLFEYPITNMYKDYPFINRVNTNGVYSDIWYQRNNVQKQEVLSSQINRNFIWFGIFKCVSPCLRKLVYYNNYWMSDDIESSFPNFIDKYSALEFLPELTEFNSEKGALIVIDSETTHDPIVLQTPSYKPVEKVDYTNMQEINKDAEYSTTVGVFKQLIKYFDYLKENDLYDNTRIIIVSDHGAEKSFDIFDDSNTNYYKARTTATLLVKDFNKTNEINQDFTFMTNADTPYLATKDIINNAKNPFTNNLLQVKNKNDYIKICISDGEKTNNRYHTKYTIKDSEWVTVHDNIFEPSNWSFLYEEK